MSAGTADGGGMRGASYGCSAVGGIGRLDGGRGGGGADFGSGGAGGAVRGAGGAGGPLGPPPTPIIVLLRGGPARGGSGIGAAFEPRDGAGGKSPACGSIASTVAAYARPSLPGGGCTPGGRSVPKRSVPSRRDLSGAVSGATRVTSCSPAATAAAARAAAKNVCNSAMSPSRFQPSPEREISSVGKSRPSVMRFCSSLSEVSVSVAPSPRRTTHGRAPSGPAPGRNTLNRCPQFVHLTVVPRSETSVSSNSYSVPQRSQVTSMDEARGG